MGRRKERLSQVMKEELSQIILRNVNFPKDVLVTLTRVDVSPDFRQAKVYVSTIPDDEKTAAFLQERSFFIQKMLNAKMKIKSVPKIRFVEEKQTAEAARIEKLIEEIHKEENG